jgi:alpha,alpha-trehalose-phosphate synthase [UDP-forming]
MKITLRLITSLVAIVASVAFVFSFLQARQEEARLKNELEKRASIVGDSLRLSIESLLIMNDNNEGLQRIVDRFSNRERLIGIDIHNTRGDLIVASEGMRSKLESNSGVLSALIQEVERLSTEHGSIVTLGNDSLYAYAIPITIADKSTHVLTLFYDIDYIHERVKRLLINNFWRALIQALLIALTTFFVIYFSVMTPIRKTTEWIRRIRKGDSSHPLNAKEQLLLGPLALEITRMAKSLEVARAAADEEARLRYSSESRWTPQRLKEFIRLKLEERPLFVVSNREPYMHIKNDNNKIECIVPASGLVTALEPVLNACGGTWIAQGSGNADRETVDKNDRIRVPPEEPKYTLRRVWVDKDLEEGFYSGFSNEGLWPLCHIAHTRPIFRAKDWEDYKAVNQAFAKAVVEELEGVSNPYILIQDYHFALLPRMIKELKPDAKIAIFWHIPWPNPESFGICPWRTELLQGMLGADLIGFHIQFHCNNFLESVDRFLESRIDYEHFSIIREGQTTLVKPFPISINFDEADKAGDGIESKEALLKKHGIQAKYVGVGVDRLDYTKGILERFRAIEHLMETQPSYRGKFTFVELGAPSRTMIPKYKEFIDEITKEVERINAKFKIKNWQPILFLMKHHSHKDILPFYKYANLCLVTSLHDGMNLVAKEYISARNDEQGVLILSQFTGAARELQDALIVNPYDVVQTSKAIQLALEMPIEEQSHRMKQMRDVVKSNNIYRWAGELVGQLTQIRAETEGS